MLSRRLLQSFTRSILISKPLYCAPASDCLSSTHQSSLPSTVASSARRHGSSASSTRWKQRQGKDVFARTAKVQNLKSRAAFKLLEINERYKLFKKGQTVVDLGFAPGSWSQVAVDRTSPGGRVVGIDIIPAQPPTGVSTIQGNFLSPVVQADVRQFLSDPERGRSRSGPLLHSEEEEKSTGISGSDSTDQNAAYLELDTSADLNAREVRLDDNEPQHSKDKTVDIVLSDMCEPWEQTEGFGKRSLSNPYFRMMNTSGLSFRDHAGSMDLCSAALQFCIDTLKPGGHFVCKFYQGSEDKDLELRLKKLFSKVHRDKPESSRSESKEAYFVALRRKRDISS